MEQIDITRFDLDTLWGQKQAFRIQLLELRDGTPLTIPCAAVMGERGPIHCIVSAQHGDEWNGAYLCQLLYKELESDRLKGGVLLLPLVNPLAFNENARVASVDKIDMNRTYTFVKRRKPTEQIAYLLFNNLIAKSDYLFDLHTGGPGAYLPHVEIIDEQRVELARALNLGYVGVVKKNQGALVPAGEREGIPSFSIEIGQARSISFEQVDTLKTGFQNYLRVVGSLSGDAVSQKEQMVFHRKTLIPASVAGFFKARVALGAKIEKGVILGEIDPLLTGTKTVIRAPGPGTVIYLRIEEVVGQGESLIHLAGLSD